MLRKNPPRRVTPTVCAARRAHGVPQMAAETHSLEPVGQIRWSLVPVAVVSWLLHHSVFGLDKHSRRALEYIRGHEPTDRIESEIVCCTVVARVCICWCARCWTSYNFLQYCKTPLFHTTWTRGDLLARCTSLSPQGLGSTDGK